MADILVPPATATADEQSYAIEDFDRKTPFSSFLPGIAGPDGTPMWCFYTNRGQGVASFGHSDKNHPILEFRPADQAYQQIHALGFRTFVRRENGAVTEPFGLRREGHEPKMRVMAVDRAGFSIAEENDGLRFEVNYATLPGERYPALVRHLRVINTSGHSVSAEILDGLPRLTPCGINDGTLKGTSTTAAAWIETNLNRPEVPIFKIRASMEDTVEVKPVTDFHFMVAVAGLHGRDLRLRPSVDPAAVFNNDMSFARPENFREGGLSSVMEHEPVLLGRYPCGFAGLRADLAAGETTDIFSLYGYADSADRIRSAEAQWASCSWFQSKIAEYRQRVEETAAPFRMRSANPKLDAYTAQTALDNNLRGGVPVVWGRGADARTFHLYGRKHGDMERDYNDFSLPASRYSAGFGNYRDMNQNRRVDVAVRPELGNSNIRLFLDLVQLDGYNPLIVKAGGFVPIDSNSTAETAARAREIAAAVGGVFTPGDLLDAGVPEEEFPEILAASEYLPEAQFGEGYWVDHWTYNLDLIDQYLRIFPDRSDQLFFGERVYRWRVCGVGIRPLERRFRETEGGVEAEGHLISSGGFTGFLDQRSTLAEKLLTLAAVKCAALGPSECGIEMEAGRPGWYDALNGLPGLFGSSVSDAAELLRLLRLLLGIGKKGTELVTLFRPVWTLLEALAASWSISDDHGRWLARWRMRDKYRSAIAANPLESERRPWSLTADLLADLAQRLEQRLNDAAAANGGILPTYFRYEPTSWQSVGSGFAVPAGFRRRNLPIFLEGAVKQIKIAKKLKQKHNVHKLVEHSSLRDPVLNMYVLNAPLTGEPSGIGRAKAFPDGWLENGSVWLHMEYKYLLELLRIGEGGVFWQTAKRCLIPFLDAERYGRSPFENSSFIASSRYPAASVHGRGFVGRLSGATAEYLTMWSEFLLGPRPFTVEENELRFTPRPVLPAEFFREDGTIEFVLFGKTSAVYRNPQRMDLFPETGYRAKLLTVVSGGEEKTYQGHLPAEAAEELRRGEIDSLVAEFTS